MKSCLQEIPLPRVLRVKELQQIEHERLVNIPFGYIRIEVRRLDKSKEEFIDNLKMRPSQLEYRFIFFRIESIASRVYLRGYRAEEVGGKLCGRLSEREWQTSAARTMLITSGYTLSVMTPR